MFSKIFAKLNNKSGSVKSNKVQTNYKKEKPKVAPTRIGELGEYKINIQLDQLPKNGRYLSDVLLPNLKSKSGYTQIDHIVLTSYGIFVIETKNYAGTIYGDRKRTNWSVNGKFQMMNPFNQNFGHIQAVHSLLKNVEISNFISLVSFTKRCTFKVNDELRKIQSNDLIIYDTELSEYINRKLNILKIQLSTPLFTDEVIKEMYQKLSSANITDQKIRDTHVEILKDKEKKMNQKLQSQG
jgi:hypothetical protein